MADIADTIAGAPAGRAPRILHVFKYYRPDFSGDAIYWDRLAPDLGRHGITGRVLAACTAGATAPDDTTLYCGGGLWRTLRLFWRGIAHADIVHFHGMVERYFLLPLLARMAGRRVVLSATLDDGLGALVRGYRTRYRPLVRLLCRALLDVSVAISPPLLADCEDVLPPSRTALIPQGVRIAAQADRGAAREAFGYTDDALLLLYVGGLTPRKDVAFLVAEHDAARGHHLLIVGPVLDDAYAATLSAAARRVGAAVRLHGPMADPSPAYAAADIFVFASTREGFGNVLLEAMQAGLPVVARRLPGVTDWLIADGVTGILFDDAVGYRTAIARLAADPGLRARMGEAGREAARNYDMSAIAARYAALYRGLMPA